mmetsp:Transcript_6186/g.38473  ORF Transcript_6186/g.38473 Transcript_6186/m.38473 type:complete len:227 (+) Transcript_6186:219-899(+)
MALKVDVDERHGHGIVHRTLAGRAALSRAAALVASEGRGERRMHVPMDAKVRRARTFVASVGDTWRRCESGEPVPKHKRSEAARAMLVPRPRRAAGGRSDAKLLRGPSGRRGAPRAATKCRTSSRTTQVPPSHVLVFVWNTTRTRTVRSYVARPRCRKERHGRGRETMRRMDRIETQHLCGCGGSRANPSLPRAFPAELAALCTRRSQDSPSSANAGSGWTWICRW